MKWGEPPAKKVPRATPYLLLGLAAAAASAFGAPLWLIGSLGVGVLAHAATRRRPLVVPPPDPLSLPDGETRTRTIDLYDQRSADPDEPNRALYRYRAAVERYLSGKLDATRADLQQLEAWPGVFETDEPRLLGAFLRCELEALTGHIETAHEWMVVAERRAAVSVTPAPPTLLVALIAARLGDARALRDARERLADIDLAPELRALLTVLTLMLDAPNERDQGNSDMQLDALGKSGHLALVRAAAHFWPELADFLRFHRR